jgi:hemerythrin
MLQGKYPGLLKHVEIHVDFIRKVFNMSQKIEQKDIVLQREILTFLASWYTTHVLGMDREYIPYITSKGKPGTSDTQ